MVHIKRIDEMEECNERLNIQPVTKERLEQMNMRDKSGDTVRIEISSGSYMCKFEGEESQSLFETNEYIFGKTVDVFKGGDSEIVWDLDIKQGCIKGWDDRPVEIYFKVVDSGIYSLLKGNKVVETKKYEYVPKFLQIDENGYGDYFAITIDSKGFIKNWGDEQIQEVFTFFNGENND